MKIIVFGAAGQVGSEVVQSLNEASFDVISITRNECDLNDKDKIASIIASHQPQFVVNCAAYTAVDRAEDDTALAHAINCDAVEAMASACKKYKTPLLHISTDYVFDGEKQGAYTEDDYQNPTGVYGASKLAGEIAIQQQLDHYFILRVSWVFGAHGHNFVKTILRLASEKNELGIVSDQWGCPTSARDIARVIKELIQKSQHKDFNGWGLYHYAGNSVTNWHQFAVNFISKAREQGLPMSVQNLNSLRTQDYPTKAKRPHNSELDTTKIEKLGIARHDWQDYLIDVIDVIKQQKEQVA